MWGGPLHISSAWLVKAGWLSRMPNICSMMGSQALWEVQGTQRTTQMPGDTGQEELLAGEVGEGERQPSPQGKQRSHLWPSLPGFSITELQRKQAMLNASKQQATGKPKGKRMVPCLLP